MDWLDLLAVQGTLKSLLQHHSSKASILQRSAFFIVQLSHPYMTSGKTIALTRRTFVDKVMSLPFNMLSRLVITFLPRSKHLLISWQIDGEMMETVTNFIFLASKIIADGDCCHEIKKTLAPWKQSSDKPRQHIKKQRNYFAAKGLYSQSCGFSSSHVWMWELDHKEGWVPKNWCFWTVVLEKTLQNPLDSKEIQPVHPRGNQSWIFIRTDAEPETRILCPPDAKNWLIRKDPDAGKDKRQEKGATEDEMVGWRQWLN